jgi:hypothetical protein
MKKSIKILGLLAIAISAFTACTDETTVEPTAAIVGFWGVNTSYTAFSIDGQLVQSDTTLYPTDSFTLNFTNNGLAISIEKDSAGAYVNDTVYYTLTGTNLQIIDKSTVPYDTTMFTANISGNKFNMKGTQIDTTMFGVVKVDLEFKATKLTR